MFETVFTILDYLVALGRGIYDAVTLPISDFLSQYESSFSSFLLDLLDFVGLADFMSEYTLGSFFLGAGGLVLLVIIIIKFFF